MEVRAEWQGGYRCSTRVRQFTVEVDEPAESGGGDTAPQPTELLLASLASCYTLAIAHVARKRSLELGGLWVTAEAEYQGMRLSRIDLRVESGCPPGQLRELARGAIPYCYVSNTLSQGPTVEYLVAGEAIHPGPPGPEPAAPSPPS